METPGFFETLLRVSDVQMKQLSTIHASDSDFLITPDTSGFAFEDFTCGRDLFDVGVRAARQVMPELKRELAAVVGQETELKDAGSDLEQSWLAGRSAREIA